MQGRQPRGVTHGVLSMPGSPERKSNMQTVDAATTLEQAKEIRRRFERGLSNVGEDDADEREEGGMHDLAMREAVHYDPNRPIASIFRWRGTVLAAMLSRRVEIYMYILLGTAVALFSNFVFPLPEYDLTGLISIPISLQTIALVFYNQQAYQRFYDQYFISMNIVRIIKSVVGTAIAWWPVPPEADPEIYTPPSAQASGLGVGGMGWPFASGPGGSGGAAPAGGAQAEPQGSQGVGTAEQQAAKQAAAANRKTADLHARRARRLAGVRARAATPRPGARAAGCAVPSARRFAMAHACRPPHPRAARPTRAPRAACRSTSTPRTSSASAS